MAEITTDFAIEYLLDDCDDCPENKDGECITQSHCFEVKQMAIKALRMMNKGEWQHDGSRWKNRFICSVCGYKLFDAPSNYCPNCGARMKGGE